MYSLSSGAAAMAMARMSARPASTTAMLGRRASPSATARLRLCRPLRRQFAAEAAASAEPEPEPAGVIDLKQRKGLPAELLGDAQWPSKQVVGWARKWRSKGNPAVLVLNVKGDLVDVSKITALKKVAELIKSNGSTTYDTSPRRRYSRRAASGTGIRPTPDSARPSSTR